MTNEDAPRKGHGSRSLDMLWLVPWALLLVLLVPFVHVWNWYLFPIVNPCKMTQGEIAAIEMGESLLYFAIPATFVLLLFLRPWLRKRGLRWV